MFTLCVLYLYYTQPLVSICAKLSCVCLLGCPSKRSGVGSDRLVKRYLLVKCAMLACTSWLTNITIESNPIVSSEAQIYGWYVVFLAYLPPLNSTGLEVAPYKENKLSLTFLEGQLLSHAHGQTMLKNVLSCSYAELAKRKSYFEYYTSKVWSIQ